MILDSRLLKPVTTKACVANSQIQGWQLAGKSTLERRKNFRRCALSVLLFTAIAIAGCGTSSKEAADAQSQRGAENRQGATPVEVAIAQTGKVREEPEYTGTTVPVQEVSLRAQVEGRVLKLNVDVGDAVKQGQIIAQLDETLLKTALNQAEAELAALKAEVARARNQVSNAKAEVEQARLELQQAQSDSQRQQRLLREGAIAAQAAEQARTTAQTAAQVLRAAQEQVRTEQQAVAAAIDRVEAQQAMVTQAREQLSYTRLKSPISGLVTQRLTEEGNLAQPNSEVLRLGDFRRVQVNVEVSELALAKIQQGQSVTVRLDAFPGQIPGQVSRISPAADQTARLVPVEVIIPNNGRIGSGLLARVSFESEATQRVVVPETAIAQEEQGARSKGRGEENSIQNPKSKIQNPPGTVFVVTEGGRSQATVTARAVKLGERADGKVEVLSGLKAGERFVARSGRPLKNGETVRLSILSEKPQQQG
jgi:RND family efflux transporter MFP subunit